MTPVEFCHWLRGLAADPKVDTAALGAQVLMKAAEIRGAAAPAAVPAMRQIRLGNFCVHNVNLSEPCAPCALGAGRLFAVRLPLDAKVVYIGGPQVKESADG
jgi:hypothetical protein